MKANQLAGDLDTLLSMNPYSSPYATPDSSNSSFTNAGSPHITGLDGGLNIGSSQGFENAYAPLSDTLWGSGSNSLHPSSLMSGQVESLFESSKCPCKSLQHPFDALVYSVRLSRM